MLDLTLPMLVRYIFAVVQGDVKLADEGCCDVLMVYLVKLVGRFRKVCER